MEINITAKPRYGAYDFIITDEAPRKAVQRLTGKKTIDVDDIQDLKSLGLTLVFSEFAKDVLSGKVFKY